MPVASKPITLRLQTPGSPGAPFIAQPGSPRTALCPWGGASSCDEWERTNSTSRLSNTCPTPKAPCPILSTYRGPHKQVLGCGVVAGERVAHSSLNPKVRKSGHFRIAGDPPGTRLRPAQRRLHPRRDRRRQRRVVKRTQS